MMPSHELGLKNAPTTHKAVGVAPSWSSGRAAVRGPRPHHPHIRFRFSNQHTMPDAKGRASSVFRNSENSISFPFWLPDITHCQAVVSPVVAKSRRTSQRLVAGSPSRMARPCVSESVVLRRGLGVLLCAWPASMLPMGWRFSFSSAHRRKGRSRCRYQRGRPITTTPMQPNGAAMQPKGSSPRLLHKRGGGDSVYCPQPQNCKTCA
jgi:hypothetical protein